MEIKLKKYLISIIFLFGAAICGVLYTSQGQYIDAEGYLHESFGFIPIAWICLFLSIISFAVVWIIGILKKKPK
ncbi:DUF3955 domain-containing protein [Acetoanaerobium noterae]|uniref:DUF3955 domain-containing protein n=1 Tax=Acetoanaerobium noterae TaxID=745369 RepID=UPI0028B0794B|nr:DUF3955 domain-containing protein [Acetoanaerobium noterae]